MLLCRPALAHQREQVLHGVLVAAAFLGGKLAGAFVQLRRQRRGLFSRTAKRHENLSEFGNFHGRILTRDDHGQTNGE